MEFKSPFRFIDFEKAFDGVNRKWCLALATRGYVVCITWVTTVLTNVEVKGGSYTEIRSIARLGPVLQKFYH